MIAAVVVLPLWWGYRWSTVLVSGSGPQGQDIMLLLYVGYILLMLALAASGSLRLMVVGDGPWPARFLGRPLLPLLAVLLAAALLPGIVDLGMRETGFAARGLAAARTGAGAALMLWAVFAPWRA